MTGEAENEGINQATKRHSFFLLFFGLGEV